MESSHNLRVGWSSLDSETIAGDDRASFAYDSSGKKVTRSNTEDYGESFDEGDVIGCYLVSIFIMFKLLIPFYGDN